MKRESAALAKTLFCIVKQVASHAQKHSAACLLSISNPAGYGSAGWKHVVLYYLRLHRETSYFDVVDPASEMDRDRTPLGLPLHGFPDLMRPYPAFYRDLMTVSWGLLIRSATLLERTGHPNLIRRSSPGGEHLLIIGRFSRMIQVMSVEFKA